MIINDTHSDAKIGLNLDLLDKHGFTDVSWGNDETASFWLDYRKGNATDSMIYVDYPDERSVLDHRFYVVRYLGNEEDDWFDGSFDTLEEAIQFATKGE